MGKKEADKKYLKKVVNLINNQMNTVWTMRPLKLQT